MAKTNIIENLFSYIAICSALLSVLLFLLNWKKCKASNSLWVILLYAFFVDFLIGYSVDFVPHKPLKIILYASYTVLEYTAFALFILLNIKNISFKKFMGVASLLFLVIILGYYLTVKFKVIDSIPIGFETILILIFAFYYLYEQLNDSFTLFVYSKPTFWIVTGMVLYLSGNFFIYIFAGSLTKQEVTNYWYITNIFSIIKNIFFCIAILLHSKPTQTKFDHNINLSSLN